MLIFDEINEAFDSAKEIIVYKDGAEQSFTPVDGQFEKIICTWNGMIDGARQMPAYGVSLNGETVKSMQKGVWVEFVFGQRCECNGMPFENLLVNVQSEFQGFNLIRYTQEYGYDGRCFYLDLVGKDMRIINNFLLNL